MKHRGFGDFRVTKQNKDFFWLNFFCCVLKIKKNEKKNILVKICQILLIFLKN